MDLSKIKNIHIKEGDVTKIQDILGRTIWQKAYVKCVKLTFTANADTTVPVYFTKESYDNKKPDDTISLTANQEKTTTYDRESIYTFKIEKLITRKNGVRWHYVRVSHITSCKIEGTILNGNTLLGLTEGGESITSNLITIDASKFDTSQMTDMSYMFQYCIKLTSLDVTNFNTSNVTDMSYMFANCSELTTLDVSNFDTSNVINMGFMFIGCPNLTTLDLSHFNIPNVPDMINMFYGCESIKTVKVSNCSSDTQNKLLSQLQTDISQYHWTLNDGVITRDI